MNRMCLIFVVLFCSAVSTVDLSAAIVPQTSGRIDLSEATANNNSKDLFHRDNLVAWCIVPFDAMQRGPEERSKMLNRLGMRRLAYDWREEHVPSFEQELDSLAKHKIELTAWWFPETLNDRAKAILDLLEMKKIKTQLWVMGSGEPANTSAEARAELIAAQVARLRPIGEAAARIGCTVGLYNHGGWFGEPENQVAIIEALKLPNVGIVYNLHHGHQHLDRFPKMLELMRPHLLCLNLNGMDPHGDAKGRKILPIGAGELDVEVLRAIASSGYDGPIGILNHTELDAAARLADNLAGLDWVANQVRGQPAKRKPEFQTWKETDTLSADERTLVNDLLRAARESGNAERGLTVFASLKTSCFSCHKVASHGGSIGPELNGIAKLRKPEELVESLFWPNRIVEDKYRATIVLRADGTLVRGYKVSDDEQTIVLRDPSTNVESSIPRKEIEDTRLGNSLMPDELMTALSHQQQSDLVRLLLDVGVDASLDMAVVDAVLAHAVAHTPETFPLVRDPLEPKRWPSWEHYVNRDRVYDFYTKQASYFRGRPHGPLLAPFPDLDGGKYGHWGNQNEETWKGNEWNSTELGSVHCGVILADGITIPRGVAVRIGDGGELATCFNPDKLAYEIVWKGGMVKFSDIRHGFMDGVHQDGETVERPVNEAPQLPFEYHGFYRHGSRVIFAYRLGDVEFLDSPWVINGRFTRIVGPRDSHPLRELTKGGPAQWPQVIQTEIKYGDDRPYAVDTIELPIDNPWQAHLFCGDHDFLADGSAMVGTMVGDVWRVEGFAIDPDKPIERQSKKATWRRIAAGLNQPLGLVVSGEEVFVMGRDQLTRLHDLNGDGEADFYECYSNAFATSPAAHDYVCGLQRDQEGNFYTASGNQGLLRISSDGKKATVLANGFRNPDGLGMYPDAIVTVPCSEGDWTPASMLCAVRVLPASADRQQPAFFGHGGPRNGQAPELPFMYLPRGVDNSSGGQVYVTSDGWGPMQNQLIHFSYGMGSHFLVLRDEVDGQLQGAAVPLVGEFLSGSHRGRFHPIDGQLYVSGMGGWGNYVPDFGCFQRVRYTGDKVQIPVGFHVHENGIAIQFAQPIDPAVATDSRNHFVQAWNYRYSGAYGSPEYSTGHHGVQGHDALHVAAAHLLDEGKTLFLELPELQPMNQLHLQLLVDESRAQELFATVHKLDKPRTDIPNYRPIVKQIAQHPMLVDLALATRRIPNPWRKNIADSRQIEIRAGKNLTFTTTSINVKGGERLALTLTNPDAVPHNLAILKPGSLDRVGQLANKLVSDPEAFLNHYVPKSDDVICYTDIVEPQQSFTIYFQAPTVPGRYPYLCTFPGHWMVMNGEMIVE